MDNNFDTGPLLKVRRFPIDASRETAYSLEQKTQTEMVRLFIDYCELAESGEALPCEPQESHRMRYLRREEFDALKTIPPHADAETIERYARAFWYPPYACAQVAAGDPRGGSVSSDRQRRVSQAPPLPGSPHAARRGARRLPAAGRSMIVIEDGKVIVRESGAEPVEFGIGPAGSVSRAQPPLDSLGLGR
jgi:methionyl-tRNA formyltransferase